MRLNIVPWTPKGVSAVPLRRNDGSVRAWTFVDDEDYAKFSRYQYAIRNGYAIRLQSMHRDVMDAMPGTVVDHRNGFRLDNRRSNLRFATAHENALSRRSHRNTSSRYRGVSWDKRAGKWRAYVMFNGEMNWLGWFVDEEEAAAVAREYRSRHMPFSTT